MEERYDIEGGLADESRKEIKMQGSYPQVQIRKQLLVEFSVKT